MKISVFLAISEDVAPHSSKLMVGNVIFAVKLFRWTTFAQLSRIEIDEGDIPNTFVFVEESCTVSIKVN